MSLFRSQIEQERAQSWLGRIILIRPASFALLTAGALAMTLAMAALFGLGEYTRKARVTGMLAPSLGTAKVVAQQSGRIEALFVREGAHVTLDDEIGRAHV